MDSLTMVRSLFEYNYWAVDRVLRVASRLKPSQLTSQTAIPHGSLWATLFHSLGAEWLWIERCKGHSPSSFLAGEESPDLQIMSEKWAAQRATTLAFLHSLDEQEFSRTVSYKSLKGTARSNILGDILIHVATHTIQHRAEAAQILTELGQSPGDLDYDEYIDARSTAA
jgi:uncharacterized damage-inducible protein DinB